MDQSLKQIASRTVGPWLDQREAEIRQARAAGKAAATGDAALLARRHGDYEDGLIGRAKAAALSLRSDLASYATDVRRQLGDLGRERDDHIAQRMGGLREERERVLHALDTASGPLSAKFRRAGLAGEEAEKAHRAVRAEVNGRPLRRSMVGFYLPVMTLLALIEVPVNRLAFELFFQEQPAVSLALAFVVGAVLVFFAHMVGTLVRRMETPSTTSLKVRRGLGLLLFIGLTGVLMYLLAGMRQLYVRLLESEAGGSLAATVQSLTAGGAAQNVTRTLSQVAGEQLGTAGWTLLVLNVVIFVFGATAAFLRHDPHPDYEAAWRQQERTRRRMTRLRGRYERTASSKSRSYDAQLASLDQLLRETESKHDELAARERAVDPFWQETVARMAAAVRNRSMAFVEGAIGEIKEGVTGSLDAVRASSEAEIRRRIGEGQ